MFFNVEVAALERDSRLLAWWLRHLFLLLLWSEATGASQVFQLAFIVRVSLHQSVFFLRVRQICATLLEWRHDYFWVMLLFHRVLNQWERWGRLVNEHSIWGSAHMVISRTYSVKVVSTLWIGIIFLVMFIIGCGVIESYLLFVAEPQRHRWINHLVLANPRDWLLQSTSPLMLLIQRLIFDGIPRYDNVCGLLRKLRSVLGIFHNKLYEFQFFLFKMIIHRAEAPLSEKSKHWNHALAIILS